MTRAGTRVEAIVELVAERLAKGAYKEGERLPSVRRAAQDHGISKNTMAEAYDRLVAQGLLEARPGSGFYVSRLELPRTSEPPPHVAAAVDLVSLLREQLDRRYEVRPGDGRPPASWMEGSELRRHFAGFKTSGPDTIDFGYGSSRGFEPLRERLRLSICREDQHICALLLPPAHLLVALGRARALLRRRRLRHLNCLLLRLRRRVLQENGKRLLNALRARRLSCAQLLEHPFDVVL